MNITNPKVSIFFLAFLPQFITSGSQRASVELFALGGVFILVALVIFTLIACLAGSLSQWFTQSYKNLMYLNRIAGAVFVGLAVKLMLSSVNT